MQKIGDSTSTANGAKEFTNGQPGTGVDATVITAEWLNAIQRELVNLVLGGGLTIVPGDDSQVLTAIQAIQLTAVTWAKLGGKPTTVSGFGITDAFTKTETATAIQKVVSDLVASSPAALDTLKELADALGNDPNFATTMTNALSGKASIASIQSQGQTAFTCAGAAPVFTLTPAPALAAYAPNQRFRVKFNADSSGADTLNISGLGPKSLKQYDSTGAKVAAVFAAGQLSDVECDGLDIVLLDQLPAKADPWLYQPVGVPIAVFDNIAGVSQPPTTNSAFRYIKMTAADAYNTGVLTSESVTGSAPLVIATAVVSLSGSPINGQTVQLINTERRSLRAGNSGGVEADQGHGHRHSPLSPAAAFISLSSAQSWQLPAPASGIGQSATTGDPVTDGTNGTPRIGNETRSKNIGVTYYMRVK